MNCIKVWSLISLILMTVMTVDYRAESLPISIKQQLLSGQYEQAAKELNALAKSGNLEAQHQLAILLLSGKGIKKSPAKAEQLLISSADNYNKSAFLLGTLYQHGKQLKKDLFQAKKYLLMAADTGHKKAAKSLKQLENSTQGHKQPSNKVQKAFLLAIKEGSLASSIENHKLGADINLANKNGASALIIAVKSKHHKVLKWLLQQSAKINRATQPYIMQPKLIS